MSIPYSKREWILPRTQLFLFLGNLNKPESPRQKREWVTLKPAFNGGLVEYRSVIYERDTSEINCFMAKDGFSIGKKHEKCTNGCVLCASKEIMVKRFHSPYIWTVDQNLYIVLKWNFTYHTYCLDRPKFSYVMSSVWEILLLRIHSWILDTRSFSWSLKFSQLAWGYGLTDMAYAEFYLGSMD